MTLLRSHQPMDRRQAREIERQRADSQKNWNGILLIGILLIGVGNGLGFDRWFNGWFLAVVLSLLMLLYFQTARTAQQVSPDTKGDAFYYLGLLFTFGSLVSALVSLSRADASDDMRGMIAPFGIALVTTIVGLFGRVWFSVWQEAPGDSVADATQALDEAIGDMKAIVVRGSQGMEDLMDNLGASAEAMEATATRIASVAEKAASTASALDKYSGHVAKLAQSFTEGATNFEGAVTNVATGVSSLKEPLEETRVRLDMLCADLLVLNKAVKQAQASVLELDRAGRDGEREMAGIASRAESVQQEMEKMQARLARTAKFVVDAQQAASTIDDHAARIGSFVSGVAGEVGRLREAAVEVASAMSKVAPKMEDIGTAVDNATSEFGMAKSRAASLGESLSELSDVAVQGREVVAGHVADLTERLDGVGTEAAATVGHASGRADTVAKDLDSLRDQLTETQRQMSQITRDSAVVVKELRQQAQGWRWRRFLFWRRGSRE